MAGTIVPFPPEEKYSSRADHEVRSHGGGGVDDDNKNKVGDFTGGSMAAMIAAAASKRNKRMNQDGGAIRMRSAAPPEPRDSGNEDFASMARVAALERKKRIEVSGGALKITKLRDVLPEHANVFVSVAEQAADMGRLVRSKEQVVEATSHRAKETDTWAGPGGLRNQESQRSIFARAISEAAALGKMKTAKPLETTNYDTHRIVEESDDDIDIDKQVDEHGRRALRTNFLLDEHVREEYREKKNHWSAPERFEGPDYASIDDVELPTEQLPKFKPKELKFTTQREALEALSNAVAAEAWERTYRLQRPKAQLKVTRGCKCPYCKNPNPYQTHKYKAMMSRNDSPNDDPSYFPSALMQQSCDQGSDLDNLDRTLQPPKGKEYLPATPNEGESELKRNNDATTKSPEKWESSNRPRDSLVQNNDVESCSIYKIQPSGSLKPMPSSDANFQSPEQHSDVLNSSLEDNYIGTLTVDGGYHASSHTRKTVLLNECVDFGTRHKRVHVKREKAKKDNDTKKPNKSKRKDGCTIM
ncbi:hypothetical protein IV203_027450 [Nitzschia inconspicua]|uniref:Uncharacterized protein n=1 Tax=Nitzschia inconspicua TaxID=303405 RepID=A0A9K3Q624_9STRA|nr:hypothetical protein IV203_027450 [Nitzschia inconspicua]